MYKHVNIETKLRENGWGSVKIFNSRVETSADGVDPNYILYQQK